MPTLRALLVSAVGLVLACAPAPDQGSGGDVTGTPDAGNPGTGGSDPTYPAAHPAWPQVVSAGGSVLRAPRIVPVFFSNDDAQMVSKISDFLARIGGSSFWNMATSEYGVGEATSAAAVHVAENAPATIGDRAIETWLVARIGSGVLPEPDANTVYALHYPSATTISLRDAGGTGKSCVDFWGYHADLTLSDGTAVSYYVVPRCPGDENVSALEMQTSSESHELVEAVTNPFPTIDPAWSGVADADAYWNLAHDGSEVADLCQDDPVSYAYVADFPYAVQRAWSNAAARAGHDPCVPAWDGEVFFAAIAEQPDFVSIPLYGDTYRVHGIKVPVGQSKTVPLHLFSDAKTAGAFQVAVYDQHGWNEDGDPDLDFQLDRESGVNGDVLQLTITSLRQSEGGYSLIYVDATLGDEEHVWTGVVGQ